MALGMLVLVVRSIRLTLSTTVGWIAFCTDVCGPYWMKTNDFGNGAPPAHQTFHVSSEKATIEWIGTKFCIDIHVSRQCILMTLAMP